MQRLHPDVCRLLISITRSISQLRSKHSKSSVSSAIPEMPCARDTWMTWMQKGSETLTCTETHKRTPR